MSEIDSELIKTYIRDAMDKIAVDPYGATSRLNRTVALEKLGQALKEIDAAINKQEKQK